MLKSYLFLNLFLSLINIGILNDSSKWNQINILPILKYNPYENKIHQNRNQKTPVKDSGLCDLIKEVKFRLFDEVEQTRTPLYHYNSRKPYENSNINLSNVRLKDPQIRQLNSIKNISEQSQENRAVQKSPSTLSFKSTRRNINNNKSQTSSANDNNISAVLKTSSISPPIVSENSKCAQTKASLSVYEKFEHSTSEVDKEVKNMISENNIEESVNDDIYRTQESTQEDVSLSSGSNEFNRVDDLKYINRLGQRRFNKIIYNGKQSDSDERGLGESKLIDYRNMKDIKQQPMQTKGDMVLSKLRTNPLLIESSRICYACSSAEDISCLKLNRQTTVKYCHKDNDACVIKSYRIGDNNHLIRDCASSCKPTEFLGVTIKHESCSICHSDLCNSAYSISLSIILSISLFAVIIVFY